MVTTIFGSTVSGLNANLVTIEVKVDLSTSFLLVGLPKSGINESQQRIGSALHYSGFLTAEKKVIINFSSAESCPESAAYDLPIALGILQASQQVEFPELGRYSIMGELSHDGKLLPIKGVLHMAIAARKQGFKGFILPLENAKEASIVNNLDIIGVETLQQATDFLKGDLQIEPLITDTRELFFHSLDKVAFDFADIQGQEKIKRAMEIAAAGGHDLILIGPPGAGKTRLAKRFPSILPSLSLQEALEATKIHSIAGKLSHHASLLTNRPFRNPHHTMSKAALMGCADNSKPGEISLAHNGVLFLDELPEFEQSLLEVIHQAREGHKITRSSTKTSEAYPADFSVIASMNPCPCGYSNHPEKECVCGPGIVQQYLKKICSPLLERIDLQVEVTPEKFDQMTATRKSESSKAIRERVIKGREKQKERFQNIPEVYCNAMMPSHMVKEFCQINEASKTFLKIALKRLGISDRVHEGILKVARTIADIADSSEIKVEHLAEAIQYRSLDRQDWAE
ncbi:YifB family Mg chelatase-like AAA ATPase [Algoriphagus sp.]|uniref:YifB family Mg chelatase-like AAA ATPase n=1 Tax=Algoriphagus sp. TaxID=1872435 RepID=UPI0026251F0F|nr:YifB family Mg chelatase-like AAA ATPase [Algoriphagus sp.]